MQDRDKAAFDHREAQLEADLERARSRETQIEKDLAEVSSRSLGRLAEEASRHADAMAAMAKEHATVVESGHQEQESALGDALAREARLQEELDQALCHIHTHTHTWE